MIYDGILSVTRTLACIRYSGRKGISKSTGLFCHLGWAGAKFEMGQGWMEKLPDGAASVPVLQQVTAFTLLLRLSLI